MRTRNKNSVKVDETTAYLREVYGFKTRIINNYHIKVFHEEFDGWFDWYHTTGTLLVNRWNSDFKTTTNLGKKFDGDEVADTVNRFVMNLVIPKKGIEVIAKTG